MDACSTNAALKKGSIAVQKITNQKAEALRRLAKKLCREKGILHSHALDRLAQDYGFKNWSMLQKNGIQDPLSLPHPDITLSTDKMFEAAARQADEGMYLLRILEGAPVALYRHRQGDTAEIVPTRRDLFQYDGGYAWGYHGSGPQNLSFALVGKLFQDKRLTNSELSDRALMLLEKVISGLDNAKEYELKAKDLRTWATGSEGG